MVASAIKLAGELVNRREAINRELSRNGVRFGVYKNGEYHDRLFPYDPIPRIIESDEFDQLEAGLKQRVNALNAYLKDIYSDKRIIHDGVIPEEYVYTSAGYFPQVNGVTPPGGIFAHIAGEDLVQGEDGRWWVLEDNLRIPSGASYPLFARDIERRTNPKLFREVHVRDNRDYPRLLRKAMDFVSTEGIAVVLTPGRYNSAFFEHAYLAEKTGAALAFPEDLEVVDNKLFFLDYAGNRHRVGAVYRRLSDEYLDPFAFNPDSVIGVPGLLSAYRSGNVAIINAPGNGAADDKAIYYFVPQMIKYYLGEEPILHNAPTYMPMFEADRKTVLDRLGELVIKDVAEAGGYGVVFGSSLDAAARAELADRIKAEPRRFIAQEVIQFRDIDVIDPATGEASPRKADLRAFVVTGQNTHVWYSGLTRYSSVPGQMIVNSSQGGGFKDTWVLAPDAGGDGDAGQGQGQQRESQIKREEAIASVSLIPHSRKHTLSLVTASKADNLYWLGRYTERAFTTLIQFYPFYDRVMDTDVDAFRPFARALDLPEDFENFDEFIHSFLYDGTNPDSVRSAIVAAFNNAVVLRPELSSRLLQYVELAVKNITDAAERAASANDIYNQRDIADDMLAFWGGIENSTADITLKAFVFIGKYIERIDLYTRFRLPEDELDAPLAKLETYSRTLDGQPLPSCFVSGISWLLGQLPDRGYPELTKRLQVFLDDFNSRAIAGDVKDTNALNAMNMDAKRP
ncbi:A circularly permuted ATPgrasp [Bifidobacterium hapali]|uniref:A circularly permuted ATPgrasp n=1 Tax=Bifidobacterium hapali TaxID=1630172 RepID=A0A261FXM3_9BIFI|nr:A circularly permuted ATPgrasp [Bifidobacterium hapali]